MGVGSGSPVRQHLSLAVEGGEPSLGLLVGVHLAVVHAETSVGHLAGLARLQAVQILFLGDLVRSLVHPFTAELGFLVGPAEI